MSGMPRPCSSGVIEQGDRTVICVMDKGCDSEVIHRLVRDGLGSDSVIPLRERNRKKVKGRYRRQMSQGFNRELYHRRNLVETAFSVLKRRYGESRRARKN